MRTFRLVACALTAWTLAAPAAEASFLGRCREGLTRVRNLAEGGLFTVRQLRGQGTEAPAGLRMPPTVSALELANLMRILVLQGNQLGFTQEASRLARQYGGAVYIPLSSGFGRGTVVVSEPELVTAVLRNASRGLVRGADFDILRQFIGEGLLSTDGEIWRHKRELFTSFFLSSHRLAALMPAMTQVIDRFLDRLGEAERRREPIDFHELMKQTTLAVITKVLFSYDIHDEEAFSVSRALAVALDFSTRYSIDVTLHKNPRLPIEDADFRRSVGDMERMVLRMIDVRLRNPLPGDTSESLPAPELLQSDMLTLMFRDMGIRPGPDAVLTAEQRRVLRDEVMTMMLAGHETTANAITWTWVNLLENPAVLARLTAEIDTNLGNRVPNHRDLRNLPLLVNVVRETLRTHSPVYWFGRYASEDVTLGQYFVPQGSQVFFSSLAVHRHPAHWPDGETFNPDRFREAGNEGRPRGSEVPFIADQHLCVGIKIATTELYLITLRIAQRYILRKTNAARVVAEGLVTLQPRGGFPVRVRHRDPALTRSE